MAVWGIGRPSGPAEQGGDREPVGQPADQRGDGGGFDPLQPVGPVHQQRPRPRTPPRPPPAARWPAAWPPPADPARRCLRGRQGCGHTGRFTPCRMVVAVHRSRGRGGAEEGVTGGTWSYRVVASNPAAASENRIHADDVAQRYGFQGGLVPGVTVYGYACHALVQALGPAWVEQGRAHVRFVAPCYDGEELVVVACSPAPSPPGRGRGHRRVKGRAWPARPPSPPTGRAAWHFADIPSAPAPAPDARPVRRRRVLRRRAGAGLGAPGHRPGHRRRLSHRDRRAVAVLRGGRHRPPRPAARRRQPGARPPTWCCPPGCTSRARSAHLRAVSVGEDGGGPGPDRRRVRTQGPPLRAIGRGAGWPAPETVAAARHTAIWQLAGS